MCACIFDMAITPATSHEIIDVRQWMIAHRHGVVYAREESAERRGAEEAIIFSNERLTDRQAATTSHIVRPVILNKRINSLAVCVSKWPALASKPIGFLSKSESFHREIWAYEVTHVGA